MERNELFQENCEKWQESECSILDKIGSLYTYNPPLQMAHKRVDRGIPLEEAKALANLLMGIFRYEPEDRLSGSQIVEYEWFKV